MRVLVLLALLATPARAAANVSPYAGVPSLTEPRVSLNWQGAAPAPAETRALCLADGRPTPARLEALPSALSDIKRFDARGVEDRFHMVADTLERWPQLPQIQTAIADLELRLKLDTVAHSAGKEFAQAREAAGRLFDGLEARLPFQTLIDRKGEEEASKARQAELARLEAQERRAREKAEQDESEREERFRLASLPPAKDPRAARLAQLAFMLSHGASTPEEAHEAMDLVGQLGPALVRENLTPAANLALRGVARERKIPLSAHLPDVTYAEDPRGMIRYFATPDRFVKRGRFGTLEVLWMDFDSAWRASGGYRTDYDSLLAAALEARLSGDEGRKILPQFLEKAISKLENLTFNAPSIVQLGPFAPHFPLAETVRVLWLMTRAQRLTGLEARLEARFSDTPASPKRLGP